VSSCTIAVVVVRWRGGDEVDRCLASVLSNGGKRLADVVLVDSGSGDGGAERLAVAFPDVRVIALTENRSFAWAAGQGVAATSADYLLLLNPDTTVLPSSIDVLAGFLDQHPEAAGAVPLLENPDGSSQHRWQLRRLPSLLRLAAGLPGAPAFPGGVGSEPQKVEQPAAAAWLLRRSVWDELGGLDPGFAPAWWEDVDLCQRLYRSGSRLWVVPAARVVHLGGSSLSHLEDSRFLIAYHSNLLRFARRHYRRWLWLIRACVRLSLLLRATSRPARRDAYRKTRRAIGEKRRP
jgi:GT2 family glycosyltransferase